MGTAFKIAHVDDSAMSRRLLKQALDSEEVACELAQFESAEALLELLHAGESPRLLLTDWNMPGIGGLQLAREIKRDPRLHGLPIAMISAETTETSKTDAKTAGVRGFFDKPLDPAALRSFIESVRTDKSLALPLAEFDRHFAAESLETLDQIEASLAAQESGFSENAARGLHTMKGSAFSLHWPILAAAVHDLESFLKVAAKRDACFSPIVGDAISEALGYLRRSFNAIEHTQPHELPPEELWTSLVTLSSRLETGSKSIGDRSDRPRKTDAVRLEVDSRAKTVRVPLERLDALQARIKAIQQMRARLSNKVRLLSQEFDGEPFVRDLEKLAIDLGDASSDAMDFFLKFRLVPISRLARFSESCAADAAKAAEKRVEFVFIGDESQEVDRQIVDLLERAALHVIRNGVDHGLDSEGRIEMTFSLIGSQEDTGGLVRVGLSDSGRGVDLDALSKKAAALGLMSDKALKGLSKDRLLEFMFIDGVTTKTSTTTLSGRGVGLAVVRQEIQVAGGTISVQTHAGKGTCFTIELPRFFKL